MIWMLILEILVDISAAYPGMVWNSCFYFGFLSWNGVRRRSPPFQIGAKILFLSVLYEGPVNITYPSDKWYYALIVGRSEVCCSAGFGSEVRWR